jgi:kinesin family member 16B
VPRICKSLFNRMKVGQEEGTGYKTQVSYLEIYNERVRDLLGPQNIGHGLRVREHRTQGPYVENLSQHPVIDFEEIHECMVRGNLERTTASTNMNDTSSRSHAMFKRASPTTSPARPCRRFTWWIWREANEQIQLARRVSG